MNMRLLLKWLAGFSMVCASAVPAAAQAKGKAPAAPPVLDSLALAPPVRHSWTSDDMRYHVGDIVTILIDENTTASANLTDNHSESKKKNLGLDVEPPPPALATTATVSFNNNGGSQKSGAVLRTNGFTAQMSARVVAISPSGLLRISGHKLVNVDKSQQDVTLSGWIRSEDISVANNAVSSSHIADAEINYIQKGSLGTPRAGFLSKVLGALWP